MTDLTKIGDIRREYGTLEFTERSRAEDPFIQFNTWFIAAVESELTDPDAMVLSTVDEHNHPDSRVVLLKGIEDNQFLFYTNYTSHKGIQLSQNPFAALNFYWPELARQIRIRGSIIKVSAEKSSQYFSSRPRLSQINAIISPQSKIVPNREFLEARAKKLMETLENNSLNCPSYWGGFALIPTEFEFWQGRDNRLHDRFQYKKIDQKWDINRFAP